MGITQMLLALGNNDTLETLGLHTNNLQDKGADAVANYMAGRLFSSASSSHSCLPMHLGKVCWWVALDNTLPIDQ